jgi:hypothetical protein
MDIKEISTKDLQAELQRREHEAALEAQRKREAKEQFWIEHLELILQLIPEHSRTSCSDENPNNYGRCDRCTLLEMRGSTYWNSSYELTLYLSERS